MTDKPANLDSTPKSCKCGGRVDFVETMDEYFDAKEKHNRKYGKAACEDCKQTYWADPRNDQYLRIRKE